MHEKPLGGRIVTPVFVVCLAVIAFLIYYSVKRLFLGLGATTGMNDGYSIRIFGDGGKYPEQNPQ